MHLAKRQAEPADDQSSSDGRRRRVRPALLRRGWWSGERGDGGGAALTWAIISPAVLLLLFGGIQFGLTSYAKGVALAAVQAGVRAATSSPADPGRAQAAAEDFVASKADGTLLNPTVSVSVSGGSITVTIIAQTQSVVPGMQMSVSQSASGSLETVNP